MYTDRMLGVMRLCTALAFIGFMALPYANAHAQSLAATKSLKDDMNADIISAEAKEGVLTIMVKPSSDKSIAATYNMAQAYYVSKNKQYRPLRMGSDVFLSEIYPDMKKIFWIKFPAPADNAATIDFYMPDFMPVEKLTITYK